LEQGTSGETIRSELDLLGMLVISPAASSSLNARRFVCRLAPLLFNLPLGNEKVALFAFHTACSSSIHIRALSVRVAFAAASAHQSGTFTKGSAFLA
jgi:hypothetical protein